MPPPPAPDPILAKAWHALSSQLGQETAELFFQAYVVDGAAALASLGIAPSESIPAAREPASVGVTAAGEGGPRPAADGGSRDGAEGGPARIPNPPTMRPTTRVNLQRQMKMLDRKGLATGYVLRMGVPGRPARRIPLLYSTILVGQEGSNVDIEIPLAETGTCLLRLTWTGTAFSLEHESGTMTVTLNKTPVKGPTPLKDGDSIEIGRAGLRIFRVLEPPGELVVVSGRGAGERYVIDTSEVRIGRFGKRDNDINLQDPTVSREHASIRHRDGKFWLEPESATSPTVVNGERLAQPRVLVDNDQLLLGEQTLLFRVRGAAARPRTLHSRVATILFSDLRGWTPLAETWPLQVLIAQMDEYFKAMGEIIAVHGGTLLTYQGDAIMAVFGAPSSHNDDPWRAVASAVGMQRQLRDLNVKWEASGRAPLSCGIGIHTGLCMVGEMGHQSRLEYTAMGDTANLAARLEQLTRDLNCDIILSDATYSEVKAYVEVDNLGEVTVKGRSVPTLAYSVRGLKESSPR
jgi:class 3 adenylate cyclase